MKAFLQKIKWYLTGKSMFEYRGFHCSLCGKWTTKPFSIPTWKSAGEWMDTWGICLDAKDCGSFLRPKNLNS